MKKVTYNKPTRIDEASFDEIFDDLSEWQLKAERLMKRRERKLRHQMMQY